MSEGSIAVLFPPPVVPLIDAFRSLEVLSEHYDLHVLEGPESDLARFMEPDAAKAVVSDAMLLAFALGRQRGEPLDHRPMRSRRGSLDEYCVLSLIAAAREPDTGLAFEAAAALRVISFEFIFAMAMDLLRRIDRGGLLLERPTLREFRAIAGEGCFTESLIDPIRAEPAFRFHS
jgi:hypothetical protein